MRDDRDDPFGDLFDELERMMNEMMGPNANFRLEHNASTERDHGGRDVHLDVHEHDDTIRVVADIPGVEKESIDLQCDGEILHFDAGDGSRRYSERVTLPGRVDEHSASATYNNGVLEVVFDRLDDSTSIDI